MARGTERENAEELFIGKMTNWLRKSVTGPKESKQAHDIQSNLQRIGSQVALNAENMGVKRWQESND
jgi:hypothetical protein